MPSALMDRSTSKWTWQDSFKAILTLLSQCLQINFPKPTRYHFSADGICNQVKLYHNNYHGKHKPRKTQLWKTIKIESTYQKVIFDTIFVKTAWPRLPTTWSRKCARSAIGNRCSRTSDMATNKFDTKLCHFLWQLNSGTTTILQYYYNGLGLMIGKIHQWRW